MIIELSQVEAVSATDLREEKAESHQFWLARIDSSPEAIEILWCPNEQRAGIAWGSHADWTDAASVDDALERYFGENGKRMVN